MPLYTLNNHKLTEIAEKPFKLEREIQTLFEANLEQIMGLKMVRSEFSIKNKRIDTLAYDEQNKAFIIIEYKREKNYSVVDQGFTYLALMLENKADFILEYQEQCQKPLKINDVDWSQVRVVFVSTSFTENQKQATNFKDIAIELWEIKRFANDTVSIQAIKKSKSATSIKPVIDKEPELKAIGEEIKVYSEDDHRASSTEAIFELYETFKEAILALADDIEVKPQKHYIAFKKQKNIACLELQRKKIKIYIGLSQGGLNDPKGISKDVSNVGRVSTGDYLVEVTDTSEIEYIMSLIKQALPH